MKKILITCLLTALLPLSSLLFPQKHDRRTMATGFPHLSLETYREWLKKNEPLDVLFVKDENVYFLNQSQTPPLIFQATSKSEPDRQGRNGAFHSYSETRGFLQELADRFPDYCRLFSIGRSIEGRDLWTLKISDSPEIDEAEAKIYIFGCHHAREWISVEIPLLFARHLLENSASEIELKNLIRNTEIFILPIVNPDGLEYSIHDYYYWRKNRSYSGDYTWGVDLNRNYGFMWGIDDQGSSPWPYSAVYRGSGPFSEPECSAVRDFLIQHPPTAALSYHNFSQLILYPWGYTEEPTPHDAIMNRVAAEMSERIRAVRGARYSFGAAAETLYRTNGDLDDWIYGTFSAPAFTIELPPPSTFRNAFYVDEDQIQPIFEENLPAILYFLSYFSGS